VLSNIVHWDFVAQNLDGQGFERANQGESARSPELTA
jgi:Fe-Mn family superoxide dismutase